MTDLTPIDAAPQVLNHYRCTSCFGIVGTEYSKEELTCVCVAGFLKILRGRER